MTEQPDRQTAQKADPDAQNTQQDAKAADSAPPSADATAKPAAAKPTKARAKPKSAAARRRAAAAAARPSTTRQAEDIPVQPPAAQARLRNRHRSIFVSFFLLVVAPMLLATWYLTTRAVDQYHSNLSFSVRKESTDSSLDLVGGLAQLAGSGSSSDADVLYQFIQSQSMIDNIDKAFDLRGLYSAHADRDPIFSLQRDATIEDLLNYWPDIVRIHYDRTAGIIELRVLAFEPEQAQQIATAILENSVDQINKLSTVAREDTMQYATEELDLAIDRLTRARQALTQFRLRTQIVDPFADLQGKMGLMNTLQAELAAALIDLGLLRSASERPDDPRVPQLQRRIDVIESQIAVERAKFGVGGEGPGGEDYATLVAEFERLTVDREFSEEAYKLALSAHDAAQAEAQRQSRYLAAHIEPTRAESSEYPRTPLILGVMMAFLLLFWAISILVFYSIRDRR
jgi:capsular polysaccharide transport system permease protein